MSGPPDYRTPLSQIAADIARELREHPENWLQDNLVRLADGSTYNHSEFIKRDDAVAWCLEGLLIRCSFGNADDVLESFRQASGIESLHGWNDQSGRTVGDVIALCDRVASGATGREFHRL